MTLSILKQDYKTQVEDFPFGTVEQLRGFAKHRDGDLYVIQDNDYSILAFGKIKEL